MKTPPTRLFAQCLSFAIRRTMGGGRVIISSDANGRQDLLLVSSLTASALSRQGSALAAAEHALRVVSAL
jgi:hypothetical protein